MVGNNTLTPDAPSVRQFLCPACGAAVMVRAMGQSLSIACGSCGTVVDPNDENHQVISAATRVTMAHKKEPLIPLGSRGKLHGTLWEVVGFRVMGDGSGNYFWDEYLLFNPAKGFRWLTQFDGHWNYVLTPKEKPKEVHGQGHYLGQEYRKFHKGRAIVKYVLGEFYWRTKFGDVDAVTDYVRAPEILTRHKTDQGTGEVTWSLGSYTERGEIERAFKLLQRLPVPVGVAPNQVSPYDESVVKKLRSAWLLFLVVIFVLQLASAAISVVRERAVYEGQHLYLKAAALLPSTPSESVAPSAPSQSAAPASSVVVTEPFLVAADTAVEVKLKAPVSNDWFEVSGQLVNETSGRVHPFEVGVEYWTGMAYDGSWAEGSQFGIVRISPVPAGTYRLNFEGLSGTSASLSYELKVMEGASNWSNMFWAMLLVSIYPAFALWRRRRFEVKRWSQSDHSPYWETQEG